MKAKSIIVSVVSIAVITFVLWLNLHLTSLCEASESCNPVPSPGGWAACSGLLSMSALGGAYVFSKMDKKRLFVLGVVVIVVLLAIAAFWLDMTYGASWLQKGAQ